ncbi:MAG TPA: DinB family protein [Candidatus Dormibacteraeota bacterium]
MAYEELPRQTDERNTLVAFLDWQRSVLERKCHGLSDAQLRERAAPPSNLSLIGLVRHMTNVERGWFRRTIAGEKVGDVYARDSDSDFVDTDGITGVSALQAWREECERSRDIAASRTLDFSGRHRTGREVSLRWVMVHMIEEYSRHNGHADLLRERIDGSTGYE